MNEKRRNNELSKNARDGKRSAHAKRRTVQRSRERAAKHALRKAR